jgi:hypothetical protein
MIYAIKDNQKIEASPGMQALCNLCSRKVFSKCGEIYVWHWAHFKDDECDKSWHEPETLWHKNWKLVFGSENSEIVIKKNNDKHIADIFTKNEVVIELQNSPISKPIIRKRETFYGEKMIWIINGWSFKDGFQIQFSKNMKYGSLNNDPLSPYIETSKGFLNVETNEYTFERPKSAGLTFRWERPRKSWENSKRNVFIDFGTEDLFWVKSGMGSSRGTGNWITKERFIRKYEGDFEKVQLLINNQVG